VRCTLAIEPTAGVESVGVARIPVPVLIVRYPAVGPSPERRVVTGRSWSSTFMSGRGQKFHVASLSQGKEP
jgi:hypothetical protein